MAGNLGCFVKKGKKWTPKLFLASSDQSGSLAYGFSLVPLAAAGVVISPLEVRCRSPRKSVWSKACLRLGLSSLGSSRMGPAWLLFFNKMGIQSV